MGKDVDHFLAQCETCGKFASSKAPVKLVIPHSDGQPYEQWEIHFIGPMPTNTTGCKFIITAVDFCTKWPMAQVVEHHNGKTVRKFIRKENIAKFGTPYPSLLTVDAMEEYFNNKYYKIKHLMTTPYHAQDNGRVERLNSVLLDIIKKLSINDTSSCPNYIPTKLMVSCSRVNYDIVYSLFEIVYGLKPETVQSPRGLKLIEPCNVLKLDSITKTLCLVLKNAITMNLNRIYESAIPATNKYKAGQRVYIFNPSKSKLQAQKLDQDNNTESGRIDTTDLSRSKGNDSSLGNTFFPSAPETSGPRCSSCLQEIAASKTPNASPNDPKPGRGCP